MRSYLFLLFVLFTFLSCLPEDDFNLPYNGFAPVNVEDGWSLSDPVTENMSREGIEDAYRLMYRDDRFTMARSLLVIRHGKMVAEAYPNRESDIDSFYNIQSCTKSITSILTGVAVQKGFIQDLDVKLYDIYPESFDGDISKRGISLRNALTMQAGLEFDNSFHTLYLYQNQGNSAAYVLAQKYLFEPGTVMHYNDGAPHLVSKALELRTGKPLAEFAREYLFSPLGIENWKWESAPDGTTFGAFSLFIRPRDLAKIGILLENDGKWEGEQILDEDYLDRATDHLVDADLNGDPYGFYFWILPEFEGYAALGHGGQFLFVCPSKDLVMVYTAWPYTSGLFFDDFRELIRPVYESCE